MTRAELDKLPKTLPDKPGGWRKQCVMHFNFGGGKGSATFEITDDSGTKMPFVYAYNTRDGYRGFFFSTKVEAEADAIGDPGEALSWKQLVEKWPAFYAELEKSAK